MTNPTTPFSWQMPTATDLVTDLPADFEVFGQAVATSMADLLGGTTGQVLSKASNTDMDFTWVTSDDANAIQNAIVDAKGDLIAATAADTPARLAVGTNGQVLTADSTAATGLKWATPAGGGGKVLQVVVSANLTSFQSINTASATDVTNMSVTITPSATSSKVLIMGMLNGINNQSTGTNAELVELDLVNASNTLIYRTFAGQCLPYAYPQVNVPFTYLHSPASTSSLTYKLRVTNNTSTYGIYVGNGNSNITCSMVAMEIGA